MTVARRLSLVGALALSACELVAGLSGTREHQPLGSSGAPACGGAAGTCAVAAAGTAAPGGGGNDLGGAAGAFAAGSGGMAAGEGGGSGEGGEGGENALPEPPPAALSCGEPGECDVEQDCTTLYVPGGSFAMGRSEAGADAYLGGEEEQPEHLVTVSPFWLDKYEVTVGRFRRFFDAYTTNDIAADAGAIPSVPSSGWRSEWKSELPQDHAALANAMVATDQNCNPSFRTWTPAAGNDECLPLNCVDWYLAFAFCIWDGGRLPSEAEWELAAAGGEENRLFPWGSATPSKEQAVFGCLAAGSDDCTPADIRPIGPARTPGFGRFGHADLAGSLMELTRDTYDPDFYGLALATGKDVVNLSLDTTARLGPTRGGNYRTPGGLIRAAARESVFRDSLWDGVGWRCARNAR